MYRRASNWRPGDPVVPEGRAGGIGIVDRVEGSRVWVEFPDGDVVDFEAGQLQDPEEVEPGSPTGPAAPSYDVPGPGFDRGYRTAGLPGTRAPDPLKQWFRGGESVVRTALEGYPRGLLRDAAEAEYDSIMDMASEETKQKAREIGVEGIEDLMRQKLDEHTREQIREEWGFIVQWSDELERGDKPGLEEEVEEAREQIDYWNDVRDWAALNEVKGRNASHSCRKCEGSIRTSSIYDDVEVLEYGKGMAGVEWMVDVGGSELRVKKAPRGKMEYTVSFGDGTSEVVETPANAPITSKGYVDRQKSSDALKAVKKVKKYQREMRSRKHSARDQSYEEWLEEVDKYIQQKAMVSRRDLPDVSYRIWYDDGVEPLEAARRALENAGFPQ